MAEPDEMSEADQAGGADGAEGAQGAESAAGGAEPTEEELRAAYEDQIRKVRVQDLVLQSAVSILQLSARRIAKEDERDLDQARIGIDAAGAMIDHVPEEAQAELRQAVSELKMLFAQQSGGGADDGGGEGGSEAPESAPEPPKKPGDSGLWTPGS